TQETTTPATPQPLSLDKQIQLEQLKHSNLQLQLELTRAQLQLAKLSPNAKPSQAISSMRPEVLSPIDNILASTPFRPLTQEVLAEGGSVPTLKDFWTKDKKERKHLSLLPNDHLFSAKAGEAGRLFLQQFDQIKDWAQTFFTHADLPSAPTTSSQARYSKKDTYCKERNYTGKCNCSPTEATYKGIHRCCVCYADHAMLQCAKHRFAIPNTFTGTPKSEDKH
ncbi:unnamed protein product, partial [Porites evermanni]